MDHILELFHSIHDDNILDLDLHMIQDWLVVYLSSKYYTFITVLFHKYGSSDDGVKLIISDYYMFVPTKVNVKSANGNTEYDQLTGIILCCVPNYPIMYPVEPV